MKECLRNNRFKSYCFVLALFVEEAVVMLTWGFSVLADWMLICYMVFMVWVPEP